ncbi:uncharacterized protein LOC144689101 [Cetorhinus maximus]
MGRWVFCWSLCFLAGSLLPAQPLLLGDDVCVPEPGWRFECGHPGISSSECTSQGCCFDPQSPNDHPCFYSLRNSPVCTADGQFIIVISKNLTRPALNLSSLYVKDGQEAECRPKLTTGQLVAFRFPITSCGSSKWVSIEGPSILPEGNGTLVYETAVLGKRMIRTGKLGLITRDSTFRLTVQCKYKGRQETGLQVNVTDYAVSPPPPASEDGILKLELRIAKGAAESPSWVLQGAAVGFMMVSLSLLVVMAAVYMKRPKAVASQCAAESPPWVLQGAAVGFMMVFLSLLVVMAAVYMKRPKAVASQLCTADGQFIIVIFKNLTRPALNLSSLYVKDGQEAECRPKLTTGQLVAFRFPITSSKWEGNGTLVYETAVLRKRMIQTGKPASITRDSTFRLNVQCKYKGRQETGLQINVTVYTVSPLPPASEDGILKLELRIAKGGDYRSWYVDSDYPIQHVLQDPVFVEVRAQVRRDPMIVLRLRDCWATPVPAPSHVVQWSLLVDGCPYEGDDYQTLLHPVDVFSGLMFPTHHKRFEVKTFVFLDGESEQPLSEQVYLHCSADVCSPSAQDDCTPKCGPKRRRSTSDHEGILVSAPGPIIFLEDHLSSELHEANGK